VITKMVENVNKRKSINKDFSKEPVRVHGVLFQNEIVLSDGTFWIPKKVPDFSGEKREQ
jgi:hypothetical protein